MDPWTEDKGDAELALPATPSKTQAAVPFDIAIFSSRHALLIGKIQKGLPLFEADKPGRVSSHFVSFRCISLH
jgi:hypothetical protein